MDKQSFKVSEFQIFKVEKSVAASIALVVFGIVALYGGEKWLMVLVPAAVLIWYEAKPTVGSGRN